MKKSSWKKLPCSEDLATSLVHKEVAASISEWKETMCQMLVRLYTSDKELYSAMCSSTGVQHNLFIMLWHYDSQCAVLNKRCPDLPTSETTKPLTTYIKKTLEIWVSNLFTKMFQNDENTRNLLETSEHWLYAQLNAGCMRT